MKHFDFTKMQGLGNDFIIIDNTSLEHNFDQESIQRICNRNLGIGCDQLILLQPSDRAHRKMIIFNSDGSMAEACGNATRCVTKFICEKEDVSEISIEFDSYISKCSTDGKDYTCNMGIPKDTWKSIPLSEDRDCTNIDLLQYGLSNGFVVNVGNPHIVFFVDNLNKIDLAVFGPKIENDELFPEKINVSFAKIINNTNVQLKVWERGAGITQACGTAACATAYAAIKKGLCINQIFITFNHGKLLINLLQDGSIEMSGEAKRIFTGTYYND